MDSAQQNGFVVCPACSGWGVYPIFSTQKCQKCNGVGIKKKVGGSEYFLRWPGFVDFSKRGKAKRAVWFLGLAGGLFLVGTFVLVAILYKYGW